jgi:hypothetical protein
MWRIVGRSTRMGDVIEVIVAGAVERSYMGGCGRILDVGMNSWWIILRKLGFDD